MKLLMINKLHCKMLLSIIHFFSVENATSDHEEHNVQHVLGTWPHCLLLLYLIVSPFTVPWHTATEILLNESFSHKSRHQPNKAIKMFVCIIEGNVFPQVSSSHPCMCVPKKIKNTLSLAQMPFAKRKCFLKTNFVNLSFF